MGFPKSFIWGAAAASYQIEGGAADDGRTPSVWDMFCDQPGKVKNGDTGVVACDHYHLYKQDVAMMKSLELAAYRFSLSWSRVISEPGKINKAGLDFYDRLVDELLANNITPWATLFHWDLPLWAFERGGWINRDVHNWFGDYAQVVVERLSDRVRNWMTLNEPQCFIGSGYGHTVHAPGIVYGQREFLLAWHHALLSHGKAAQIIRRNAKITPHIGAALTGQIAFPDSDAPENIEAARQYMYYQDDTWNYTFFADPMVFGEYPKDLMVRFEKAGIKIGERDMHTIAQPLDFFGTNIYNGARVAMGSEGPEVIPHKTGFAKTSFKWPVTPEALYWGPRFLYERYELPIVITENGMANADIVSLDGQVHDPQRIDFLQRYLRELRDAVNDEIDIRGYFAWSIMDNFEWAEGYGERFGLVHVDYETLKRIPKDSAYWYRDVIRSNGKSL